MKSEFSDIVKGVRWVWFDLDDTLVDFRTNSRKALHILYEKEGLSRFYPSADAWIDAYETHNHHLWDMYSRNEITQEFLRIDRFATPLRDCWSEAADSLVAYSRKLDPLYLDLLAEQRVLVAGARELVEYLRGRKYNIGVLSNGFTEVQNKKLRNCQLDSLVDVMVLSDDIGVNKPDVRLFRYAMERVGENDERKHLMIGDNAATDILGAVNAGWRSILLDHGSAELEMREETLVTPTLMHLLALKW